MATLPVHTMPVPGRIAGYGWLNERYRIGTVPLPHELHGVANKQVHVKKDGWVLHPSPRWPGDGEIDHLVFALKYEGLNLLILKRVFEAAGGEPLASALSHKPGSSYLRRLAFLFEYLVGVSLPVPDSSTGTYVPVLDEKLQYGAPEPVRERRFRIWNNLPGLPEFCPLVARTRTLETYMASDLAQAARSVVSTAPQDVLARAAAYLLLSDSKASFEIEKERPAKDRLARWGTVIGRAGRFELSTPNLESLQKEVIGDSRHVRLGLRQEGGFVGEHGPLNEPLPQHISAKASDLDDLMNGIVAFDWWSEDGRYDPVLSAASLAFGFVYIHPFEDGNGRIHRFLIHNVLARRGFTPDGIVFPISKAILHDLLAYRLTLESWSKPLLSVIDWVPTPKGNIEVRGDTTDLYRYFDATPHAEFLFACLKKTIEDDLPRELRFLEIRDRFHRRGTEIVDMPERLLDLLLAFLKQGNGALSRRVLAKEFSALTADEVTAFETLYAELTAR